MLPQLDSAPGYKRVAALIETEILEGRLEIGAVLPVEGELAEQLGVHRSTVREGLRALENAGLVRRGAGKRLVVTAPDPAEVARVNARALGLKQVSFNDMWEIQMLMEPYSAKLAAQRATPDQVAALKESVAQLKRNIDDDAAVIRHDIAFHRLVAEAAGNAPLSLSVAPIGVLLFSATLDLYQAVPAARRRLAEAHEQIVNAIADHDAARAEAWMLKHIRDFKRGYELSGQDPAGPIHLDAAAIAEGF
jgi:GntR family transcriptional repressor for pyruvate dehydrogenase complex